MVKKQVKWRLKWVDCEGISLFDYFMIGSYIFFRRDEDIPEWVYKWVEKGNKWLKEGVYERKSFINKVQNMFTVLGLVGLHLWAGG